MKCLEGLLNLNVPELYGKCTGGKEKKKLPKESELVIREASEIQEMFLFAECTHWGQIRELAKQKMKSR